MKRNAILRSSELLRNGTQSVPPEHERLSLSSRRSQKPVWAANKSSSEHIHTWLMTFTIIKLAVGQLPTTW